MRKVRYHRQLKEVACVLWDRIRESGRIKEALIAYVYASFYVDTLDMTTLAPSYLDTCMRSGGRFPFWEWGTPQTAGLRVLVALLGIADSGTALPLHVWECGSVHLAHEARETVIPGRRRRRKKSGLVNRRQ